MTAEPKPRAIQRPREGVWERSAANSHRPAPSPLPGFRFLCLHLACAFRASRGAKAEVSAAGESGRDRTVRAPRSTPRRQCRSCPRPQAPTPGPESALQQALRRRAPASHSCGSSQPCAPGNCRWPAVARGWRGRFWNLTQFCRFLISVVYRGLSGMPPLPLPPRSEPPNPFYWQLRPGFPERGDLGHCGPSFTAMDLRDRK